MHILHLVGHYLFCIEFSSIIIEFSFGSSIDCKHYLYLYNIESIKWIENSTKNMQRNWKIVARERNETTCANVDTQPHTAWATETEIKNALYFCNLHTLNSIKQARTHAPTQLVHKHSCYEHTEWMNEYLQLIPMDTMESVNARQNDDSWLDWLLWNDHCHIVSRFNYIQLKCLHNSRWTLIRFPSHSN